MFSVRAAIDAPFYGVHGNEIHHGVMAGQQFNQPINLFFTVIYPLNQRPLVLRRVARLPCPSFGSLGECLHGHFGSARQKRSALLVIGGMERNGECRTSRHSVERLKEPFIPHRRDHQVFMPESAVERQKLHCSKDVLKVV